MASRRNACVVAAVLAALPAAASAAGQWVLTFEDDFNGDALNTSSWTANNYSSIISQYDGHDALFVADAVTVTNGTLVLTTWYQPTSFEGVNYNMLSGWVDTQGKLSQQRGRFEANMKLPPNAAVGAWPAAWLLPNGTCWPVSGEVDIMEQWAGQGHFQHNDPGNPISIASTYHFGYSCTDDKSEYARDSRWFPNMSDTSAPLVDFSAGFHTFGVEINDTALRFYVDDPSATTFVRTMPSLCVTDPAFEWGVTPYMPWQPMYMILNTAVAAGSNTSWWQENNRTTTLVDWVRWYAFEPDAEEQGVTADGGGKRGACA